MLCSGMSLTRTGGPPEEQTLAAGHYRRTDGGYRERQEAESAQFSEAVPEGNAREANGKDCRSAERRRARDKSRKSASKRPGQRAAEGPEEP